MRPFLVFKLGDIDWLGSEQDLQQISIRQGGASSTRNVWYVESANANSGSYSRRTTDMNSNLPFQTNVFVADGISASDPSGQLLEKMNSSQENGTLLVSGVPAAKGGHDGYSVTEPEIITPQSVFFEGAVDALSGPPIGGSTDIVTTPVELRGSDGNRLLECMVCGAYLKRVEYRQHVNMHQGNYTCRVCGKTFFADHLLKKHVRLVHREGRRFECETCGKRFIEKTKMQRHVETVHLRLKTHQCEVCGKGFSRSDRLRFHLRSSKFCREKLALKSAQGGVEGDSVPQSTSKAASVTIPSASVTSLTNSSVVTEAEIIPHQSVILEDAVDALSGSPIGGSTDVVTAPEELSGPDTMKLMECMVCGVFLNRVEYKQHVDIHQGNYTCRTCSKTFASDLLLRKHVRFVHREGRNFECETCGKSFIEKAKLKRHIKTVHLRLKTHQCEVCSKWFPRSDLLKLHMRSTKYCREKLALKSAQGGVEGDSVPQSKSKAAPKKKKT